MPAWSSKKTIGLPCYMMYLVSSPKRVTLVILNPLEGAPRASSNHNGEAELVSKNVNLHYWKYKVSAYKRGKFKNRTKSSCRTTATTSRTTTRSEERRVGKECRS